MTLIVEIARNVLTYRVKTTQYVLTYRSLLQLLALSVVYLNRTYCIICTNLVTSHSLKLFKKLTHKINLTKHLTAQY